MPLLDCMARWRGSGTRRSAIGTAAVALTLDELGKPARRDAAALSGCACSEESAFLRIRFQPIPVATAGAGKTDLVAEPT